MPFALASVSRTSFLKHKKARVNADVASMPPWKQVVRYALKRGIWVFSFIGSLECSGLLPRVFSCHAGLRTLGATVKYWYYLRFCKTLFCFCFVSLPEKERLRVPWLVG